MPNCEILGKNYTGGDLIVNDKKLVSLEGCPTHITGTFNCSFEKLKTLVGGPQRVDGNYKCAFNRLTDLVGCASHISGTLIITDNKITSLVGIHKIIKSCNTIWFNDYKITQGGIGLLLIENLTNISYDDEPFQIIAQYLGSGTKGMMECSKELISSGYDNYAKL